MTGPQPGVHVAAPHQETMDAFDELLVDYAIAIRAAMQVGDFPNMNQRHLDTEEAEARFALYAFVAHPADRPR